MNCEIIRDILPLYHDEVVSEESRRLVEGHIETCPECRKMLAAIHENVRINNAPDMEQQEVSGFKLLQKLLRRKTLAKS